MTLFPVVYVSHPKHTNGLAIILYSPCFHPKNLFVFPPKAFHHLLSILKCTVSFLGQLQLHWVPVSDLLKGSSWIFSASLAMLCSASFQQTVPYLLMPPPAAKMLGMHFGVRGKSSQEV
jgi:hypothetical protein